MRHRQRFGTAGAALLVILSISSCAPMLYSEGGARTYLGFTLGIESAPPPPRLQFREEPRYESVAETSVQVVFSPDPNCDMFRYGSQYYVYSSGFWYVSDRYDGPFEVVEVHRVPRQVLMVPESHWRHRPHFDRGNHGGKDKDDRGEHRGHDDDHH